MLVIVFHEVVVYAVVEVFAISSTFTGVGSTREDESCSRALCCITSHGVIHGCWNRDIDC